MLNIDNKKLTLFACFNSLSGYCNALIFKDLTATDIETIEKFMRERALERTATAFSESLDENCDVLVDEEQMNGVFGENYANHPEQFEFSPGEKKLLMTLASHVKKLVDGNGKNTGLALFNEKKKQRTKKLLRVRNVNHDEAILAERQSQTSTPTQMQNCDLSKKLFERLLSCLDSYAIDPNGWTEESVTVNSSSGDKITGGIKCSFCGENQKPTSVFFNMTKRSGHWVVANFEKHLEKRHKLVKLKHLKTEVVELKYEPVQQNESKLDVVANDDALETMDSMPIDNETEQPQNQLNDSVQYLGVVSESATLQANNNTDNWLYKQISEQIQEMVAANLINNESEASMEINLKDKSTKSISLVKMLRDGDCMFSALAHQLWKNPINSEEHKTKTKELRAIVVEHILNKLSLIA